MAADERLRGWPVRHPDLFLDAQAKLERYAVPVGSGPVSSQRWAFDAGAAITGMTHSRQSALDIIDACLLLELPVTDTVSGRAWLTIVRRLADTESRVAELAQAVLGRRVDAQTDQVE